MLYIKNKYLLYIIASTSLLSFPCYSQNVFKNIANVCIIFHDDDYFEGYPKYIFNIANGKVIYEEVYSAPEQRISELVFSEIIIRYDDPSKDVDTNDPVVVSTTAENKEILDKEDFILLYSNEKVDIYKHYSEKKAEETCDLIIYNKTEASMSMECDGVTADNKEVKNPYIFYGKYVPPHYAFVANYYHAFDKEYGDTKGKDVQSSFTFKFREDPQMSFSTGFFDM